jgi:hypothetical protein
VKLKESQLKTWLKQRQPIAAKSDGGGLTFTLSASGTASWVFRYRHAGKQREMTFGNYPDMPLETGRPRFARSSFTESTRKRMRNG